MPSDRLRTLTRPKTLLLLGGAFGFVLLVAGFTARYRLVPDGLARVPESAVAAAVILDPAALSVMSGLLPPAVRYRLEDGQAPPLTFFAVPDEETGKLEWHDLAALNSVPPGADGYRLVRRTDDLYGEVRTAALARTLPFHGTVNEDRVRLTFGREPRGWTPDPFSALPEPRRLKVLPPWAESYLYAPDARAVAVALDAAAAWMDMDGWPSTLFGTLPGTLELAISASGSLESFRPFLAYSRLRMPMNPLRFEVAGREFVAAIDPQRITMMLADGSTSTDLRPDPKNVGVSRNRLSSGEIVRFFGPTGTVFSVFLQGNSEVWMTSGTTTLPIQQGILSEVGHDGSIDRSCLPSGRNSGIILGREAIRRHFGGLLEFFGLTQGYSSVSLIVDDETPGLFAVCGYL